MKKKAECSFYIHNNCMFGFWGCDLSTVKIVGGHATVGRLFVGVLEGIDLKLPSSGKICHTGPLCRLPVTSSNLCIFKTHSDFLGDIYAVICVIQ